MTQGESPQEGGWLARCWRAFVTLLVCTDTPLWVTLLLIVGGAAGTYWLAPKINKELETAKIKSAYVSDNLKNISAETSDIVAGVKTLNRQLDEGGDRREVNRARQEVTTRLTKLKWKAIELSTIAETTDEKNLVLGYHRAIEGLANQLEIASSKADISLIEAKMSDFITQTYVVMRLLGKKADLRFSVLE